MYKSVGRIPNGFTPAGDNPNAPDFILKSFKNINAIFELKSPSSTSSTLDFGQLGLQQNNAGLWNFRNTGNSDNVLESILRQQGVIERINSSKWGTKVSEYLKRTNAGKSKESRTKGYMIDRETFYACSNWITIPTSTNLVSAYYASKGVNYINIENRGLYLIGSDVLQLSPPKFTPSEVNIKVRNKTSVSNKTMRFTIAVRVSGYPNVGVVPRLEDKNNFLSYLQNIEFPKINR
jgi:hypothetical protein